MTVSDLPRQARDVQQPLQILAVSPHLDDAAFSAGATLATLIAHGHRVTLVTAFTASVEGPAEVDVMALRRVEDMEAAARLGVQRLVHLPFPEAEHRGYDTPEARTGPLREDDDVAPDLRAALDILGSFDLILAPQALGDHVDHRQLRRALGLPGRCDDPAPVARFSRGPVALWRDTPHVLSGEDPPTPGDDAVVISGDALKRKLAACACYATKTEARFGTERRMRQELSDLAFSEGSRHGRPAPAETFVPASPVVRALRTAQRTRAA
jgi:LmbE family N-acetylglucosaminyl deacetylase